MQPQRPRNLVLALLAATLLLSSCSQPIREQLKEFGFSEIQPPSTLLPPGTVIMVKQQDPLVVGIICTAQNAFGAEIANKLVKSASTTSMKSSSLEGSFDLAADYVKSVSGSVQGSSVESIGVTMANVALNELPDDAVMSGVKSRTPECRDAIKLRRANGAQVSMVKSVVAADVTYMIRYRGSVDAAIRADMTKQVAARLGLSGAAASESSVTGKHLYWGIRDDMALAAYEGVGLPATGTISRARLIEPGKPVLVVAD
ncbi:hypothetical protein [Roseateles sp. LYH14W]|uniref:DUF541 domain-containing protein n=1 Tax=Pelomonas parva TaxID=3299032 RepID=A0ABW7FAT9_9BURK